MNLSCQIHILLIQKSLNAVKHSIYLMKASLFGSLVYACQAGIDYGSGTTGLSYNNVTFLCHC